ncbi:MAG TPA: glycosyltransferase family 2 protein [Candidatus Aminicenantes bacterium]|nr:glycosyltransferase family 2 protein [Candidatus Aminicenantes bacterium]
MAYTTSLRPYTLKRLEEIGQADIIVGIPCYNNEKTIAHVIQMVTHGLDRYYRNYRNLIFIADGGSTDDTREVAKEFQIKPWQEKLISIYRGIGGKGSALRSVFEAACKLKVKACVVVDADLRSITSDWVFNLIDPILEKGYDFVSPIYKRHKYDGTITNNIVYNLTRALYGQRIRQPIGGDFALNQKVAQFYIQQDVWETDVARFGIDIWMTTNAIIQGFKLCQANLGVKIHDVKDPSKQLGPMFRQVLWVLFSLMEQHESYWKIIRGSQPVEILGEIEERQPEEISVNLNSLIYKFKIGFQQFSSLWKEIFSDEVFAEVEKASKETPENFRLPVETWVKILYELAATFHAWPTNRFKIVELVTPLYYGRIADFVIETADMNSDQAEMVIEQQADIFEKNKDYLIKVWEEKSKIPEDRSSDWHLYD